MNLAELKGDVVILACAISAGIHGALVPGHFDEGTGAGLGFVAATVALAGLVVWLTWRPANRSALAAAAVTLAGLLASYALATRPACPSSTPTLSRSTASPSPPRRSRPSACSRRRACSGGTSPPPSRNRKEH